MKDIKPSGWGIIVDKSKARYEVIMTKNAPQGTPGYLKPGSEAYKELNKDRGKIYDHETKKIITMDEFEKQTKSIEKLL